MAELITLRDGGTLLHDPHFYTPEQAAALFEELRLDVEWGQEVSRGRPFPRLNAYFADDGVHYSYSGVTHFAKPWSPLMLGIKERVETVSASTFNSLLLNLYRDGSDSIGFHTDYDSQVGENPVIASLTFGAVRTFVMRHTKSGEKLSLPLGSGSLLVMGGTSQHHYHHGVPKTAADVGERINLTFRLLKHPAD